MCVSTPLRAGTWRCYGGRGSTGARGVRLRARLLRRVVTCTWCSGRPSTAAWKRKYVHYDMRTLLAFRSGVEVSHGWSPVRAKQRIVSSPY